MRLQAIGIGLLSCCIAHGTAAQSKVPDPAPAHQRAVPQLPLPSGPFGVGRIAFDLMDQTRPDRYSSDPKAHRELMVYLWYPAAKTSKEVRGTYLPGAREMDANPEVRQALLSDYGANWPLIVSGEIYSHAQDDAAMAKSKAGFPLLVFSPGMGGFSFGYTSLIEDLVSHGYAVAAIEYTYNAPVVFSDGRVVPARRETIPNGLPPDEALKRMAAIASTGITEAAGDIRFVLAKLIELKESPNDKSPVIERLDLMSAVAIGHSAGAASTARACQLDARFRACIDLDGGMVPVAALPDYSDGATMKQPLLFLEGDPSEGRMFGTHEQHVAYFKKKEEQLESCPQGSYDVALRPPGMMHGSFSDDPLLEAADASATERAVHNLNLIETYIRAFLARTLKGDRNTILDASAAPSPEATIHAYGR